MMPRLMLTAEQKAHFPATWAARGMGRWTDPQGFRAVEFLLAPDVVNALPADAVRRVLPYMELVRDLCRMQGDPMVMAVPRNVRELRAEQAAAMDAEIDAMAGYIGRSEDAP